MEQDLSKGLCHAIGLGRRVRKHVPAWRKKIAPFVIRAHTRVMGILSSAGPVTTSLPLQGKARI